MIMERFMRYLRKFLLFLGIAIVLQSSVLFYIDRFYLVEKKDQSDTAGKQLNKKEKLGKVQIPTGADNIQASWDGKYVSYYENAELKVVDTETLEINKMKFEDNTKVSIYKWVQDKNRIIIGGKKEDKFKNVVSFAYLDLKEKDNYKAIGAITMPDKKSEIGEIECSNSEDEIYVKLNNVGNRNSIYKLKSKGGTEKLQLKSFSISNIEVLKQRNQMLYEDGTARKIYIFGAAKPIDVKSIGEARLLSVDKEENIYVAQMENSKVKSIYWGKQIDSVEKWNSKQLEREIEIKDLILAQDGKVYVNDNLKGSVVEVSSGKAIFYKGKFLQLYADGVASIWGECLVKTKFQ